MKVDMPITEPEQALLDYQQVGIADLDIYPQLLAFLQDQGISTVANLLNLSRARLGAELSLEEDAAEYLLKKIDDYFDNQPILPFVYPALPPDCFQKSLDVLDLPKPLTAQLEQNGIQRLGLLASLDQGENNPMTQMVKEALARYVQAFRATTESQDIRQVNVSYSKTDRWSLRQLNVSHSPSTTLAELDLPQHLLAYMHNLGIERVDQLADLSHHEMKLLLGLEHDAVDFLYATINQHVGKETAPIDPLLEKNTHPPDSSAARVNDGESVVPVPGSNVPSEAPVEEPSEQLARQAVHPEEPLENIERSRYTDSPPLIEEQTNRESPELSAAPVALPDFCQTPTEPEEQQRLLAKYGQHLPTITEADLLQVLVDQRRIAAERRDPPPEFEQMAEHLLALWQLPLEQIAFATEAEQRTVKVLHIKTLGELLETIMQYNLQWLQSNATQESPPPNLGLTPLLIYIKQMREQRQHFMQPNWSDRLRHGLMAVYRWLTGKNA